MYPILARYPNPRGSLLHSLNRNGNCLSIALTWRLKRVEVKRCKERQPAVALSRIFPRKIYSFGGFTVNLCGPI
jgi:hypothetical protein